MTAHVLWDAALSALASIIRAAGMYVIVCVARGVYAEYLSKRTDTKGNLVAALRIAWDVFVAASVAGYTLYSIPIGCHPSTYWDTGGYCDDDAPPWNAVKQLNQSVLVAILVLVGMMWAVIARIRRAPHPAD